jgi:hypothetical protein
MAMSRADLGFGAPRQVSRSGSFELACNAEVAFPLFSPEGERDWVTGWEPRPVFPENIVFDRETVFREGKGHNDAIWIIVGADWKTHRAEYVRVASASHAAHIVVKVDALDAGRSNVTVSYTVTAFGTNAGTLLESFSEDAYAAKMRDWQRRIGDYLRLRLNTAYALEVADRQR